MKIEYNLLPIMIAIKESNGTKLNRKKFLEVTGFTSRETIRRHILELEKRNFRNFCREGF